MSPSGSASQPNMWGACLRISSRPIAASSPLITLDGKKAATKPARATPRAIWTTPATTTASKKAWNEPSAAIWARTMAVNPGEGPLTLVCEPLSTPTTRPPTMPASTPAKYGAFDADATPKHKGSAAKKTTRPAVRSLAACRRQEG